MPSGRTHDRITLWSLPLVAGLAFERTRSSSATLLIAAGFLFSGLMFGPDLDIYSHQYRRWGWLRWIWLPYRRGMRHRSVLSHGPIVGTVIRILYLACWCSALVLLSFLLVGIVVSLRGQYAVWQAMGQQAIDWGLAVLTQSWQQYPLEWVSLLIGLELGAMSHALSDWACSSYRRLRQRHRSSTDRTPSKTKLPTPLEPFSPNQPEPLSPPQPIQRQEPQLPPFPKRDW